MIKQKLQALEDRERLLLLLGSPLALALLLYLLAWRPLTESGDSLRRQIDRLEQELAWMQGAAAQIRAFEGSRRPGAPVGSLQGSVSQEAARSGVRISRLQPGSSGNLNVWIDRVAFNQLLEWVDRLNRRGIQVDDLNVRKEALPGMVTAKVVVGVGS